MVRVLVVEDEPRMATLLQRGLREEGYAVDVAHDGTDGLWLGTEQDYDAIVLDVMLPGIDGLEVCRRLRAADRWAPILLLTARLAVEDRVHGLDAGADDYLTKPFFLEELLARLRAFDRRPGVCSDGLLRAGILWWDPARQRAGIGSTEIALTVRQGAIFEVFMRHPGQVLTRGAIADAAWDGTLDLASNVIDVHVGALRRKLSGLGVPVIQTVRGLGYRLDPVDS